MRTHRLVPAVAVLILATAASLGLRPHSASDAPPPDPRLSAVKLLLRDFVVTQEKYYFEHGTYTTDLPALRLLGAPKPDSVVVYIIHAGGRSWTGAAFHHALRGKTCVIYVGFLNDFPSPPVTQADSVPAREEGQPVCDGA
jgi:hypothetical protein